MTSSPFGVNATPLESYHALMMQLKKKSTSSSMVGCVSTTVSSLLKEHNYNRPWNVHPDPKVSARPTKFLFMSMQSNGDSNTVDEEVDVETIDDDDDDTEVDVGRDALLTEILALGASSSFPNESDQNGSLFVEKAAAVKNNWTPIMFKLYTKTLKVLHAHRLAVLSLKTSSRKTSKDFINRKNISDKTVSRLRRIFASICQWDVQVMSWLHKTLTNHVTPVLLIPYHESMLVLRTKIPSLVDSFYVKPSTFRSTDITSDPISQVINNFRPKRLPASPLFLLVTGHVGNSLNNKRLKDWMHLFASLGKVVQVVNNRTSNARTASSCLMETRILIREKVREVKRLFGDSRPIIIVGFGPYSVVAAHSCLDNSCAVHACICLGFPLTSANGFRGDLDDPLLESPIPILFVIGSSSPTSSVDDMEDFRERFTKTTTGLVVVGGASNDRLIVSSSKKRSSLITQSMVDRVLADEIYEFLNEVLFSGQHLMTNGHQTNRQTWASESVSPVVKSTTIVRHTPPAVVVKKKSPSTPAVSPMKSRTPSSTASNQNTMNSSPNSMRMKATTEALTSKEPPGVVKRKKKMMNTCQSSIDQNAGLNIGSNNKQQQPQVLLSIVNSVKEGSMSAPPTLPSSPTNPVVVTFDRKDIPVVKSSNVIDEGDDHTPVAASPSLSSEKVAKSTSAVVKKVISSEVTPASDEAKDEPAASTLSVLPKTVVETPALTSGSVTPTVTSAVKRSGNSNNKRTPTVVSGAPVSKKSRNSKKSSSEVTPVMVGDQLPQSSSLSVTEVSNLQQPQSTLTQSHSGVTASSAYEVSAVNSVLPSSTRTRTIKPPKQLDI